jgi:sulfite reductase (NADPH) flavoprotein alpha-component
MVKIPTIPSSAPFTPEQRAWLNGYLAGLFTDATAGAEAAAAAAAPPPAEPLVVLYGSQTGTAEQLAKRLARDAAARGFVPTVLEMNAWSKVDLLHCSLLVLITSTWGDGDPPDNAAAFWQYLNSDAAPGLPHVHYAVLALGDRNYSDFCGAGRKFDERLQKLGAQRLQPRGECDVDYEATAGPWIESLWPLLKQEGAMTKANPANGQPPQPGVRGSDLARIEVYPTPTNNRSAPASVEPGQAVATLHHSPITIHGRNNPFPARLITNCRLNGPGSAKDTRHFEITLEGSGLSYEVGDALGVKPLNCPGLVEEILRALACDGEEAVKTPEAVETSLRTALSRHYQITQPPTLFVRAVADRSGEVALRRLLEPDHGAELSQFLYGREIIDLLLAHPCVKFSPDEFVGLLRPLQPRLYSIASSLKAHPGEVHLTVATVRYSSHGRARKGVCSTFLAESVVLGVTPVPVFVQAAPGFRLPSDPGRPIILIGPGTGIAPFRAFLEERRATGAAGKNWLFFGDQQRACDFLYREQLEGLLAQGALTRLDTAFSRDQAEKVYVQHRLLENAPELYSWLENGAHLYVCGDAKRMARDVDAALHESIQRAGDKSAEQAADYVRQLKADKRYQRDVY